MAEHRYYKYINGFSLIHQPLKSDKTHLVDRLRIYQNRGYYTDPFIKLFLLNENPQPSHLNYLYYLRTTLVWNSIISFHAKHGLNSQVVVLGCGYDTLYWRLLNANLRIGRWFDLDLPEVIARKSKIISANPIFTTDNYYLRFLDLRSNFGESLIGEGFDRALPTFFFDEFSMIYIEPALVEPVLRFSASLETSYLISIGLSNMEDDFGRHWIEAFGDNNTPLKGLSEGTWESLFEKIGFGCLECTMFENEVQRIGKDETARVAALEVQDHTEELSCFLRHYMVIRASAKSH
jgi:[phosphatase 2A protein]-leucine-carboxy methyltransferase